MDSIEIIIWDEKLPEGFDVTDSQFIPVKAYPSEVVHSAVFFRLLIL